MPNSVSIPERGLSSIIYLLTIISHGRKIQPNKIRQEEVIPRAIPGSISYMQCI